MKSIYLNKDKALFIYIANGIVIFDIPFKLKSPLTLS